MFREGWAGIVLYFIVRKIWTGIEILAGTLISEKRIVWETPWIGQFTTFVDWMLQKDDPKIGPRNSPKNGLVVEGSHGPMFQSSFYPVLSTKRLVAKSILVPIFT